MAQYRTFIALSQKQIGALIMDARQRVIYAAPSLSLDVASALVNAEGQLGSGNVSVVLDVSEGVFRLGYGVVDALHMLREQNIAVRHADGLRISFVVVDNVGYIFALPPLLVEAAQQGDDRPNAVRASADQIEQLAYAVVPRPKQSSLPDGSAATSAANPPADQKVLPLLDRAEIGQKVAPTTQIEKIDLAIKANPVENFDLARVVSVFCAYIQFYEFKVVGAQVQNRTVQLPKALLASIRDKATRDRITAAFKLVANDSKVSSVKIDEKAAKIRRRFIRHHSTYGGVILKSSRADLEAEIVDLEKLIEAHKKTVLDRFGRDAKKSIEELVKAFWRDIARKPPQDLVDQLGMEKPSTEQAKDYLRHTLVAAFPKAEELADSMLVKRVVKDVTWSTLNEPGFVDWVKDQFPHRKDLQQPFELYRAAREALKSNPQKKSR
jgi:hypothetical protein